MVARSEALVPVVVPRRASIGSQKGVPNAEVLRGEIGFRVEHVAALLGEREADQAAPEFRHEIDGFGRDFLGRHGQVAFVFAVFVVDEDDHAALANFVESLVNRGENVWLGHLSVST